MKQVFLGFLADCVCCTKCKGHRIFFDQASGVPPRGFGYPENVAKLDVLFVLYQPHPMDPYGRDSGDAANWRRLFRSGCDKLAIDVNRHTRHAFETWQGAVQMGLRELTMAIYEQPFGQVKDRVAITNLVKCELRKDEKRKPLGDCVRNCVTTHLVREIEAVKPKVLVAMESSIRKHLTELNMPVTIVSCYHPGEYNRRTHRWNNEYVSVKGKEIAGYLRKSVQ